MPNGRNSAPSAPAVRMTCLASILSALDDELRGCKDECDTLFDEQLKWLSTTVATAKRNLTYQACVPSTRERVSIRSCGAPAGGEGAADSAAPNWDSRSVAISKEVQI